MLLHPGNLRRAIWRSRSQGDPGRRTQKVIAQTSFETSIEPEDRHRRRRVSPAKNADAFIPDDFEHEIATSFLVKGK